MRRAAGAWARFWRLAGAGCALLAVFCAGAVGPAAAQHPGEPRYLGIYGRFGEMPLLILAQHPGAPLTVRLASGLRRVRLDAATAARLLPGLAPTPVEGLPGVTVYAAPGTRPFELSYPQGSPPVLWVADPAESPGTGGSEGGGAGGGGGGGGGCSCS